MVKVVACFDYLTPILTRIYFLESQMRIAAKKQLLDLFNVYQSSSYFFKDIFSPRITLADFQHTDLSELCARDCAPLFQRFSLRAYSLLCCSSNNRADKLFILNVDDMSQISFSQRQITLRIMGYHFSSRLTVTLNLCLIYFKIT